MLPDPNFETERYKAKIRELEADLVAHKRNEDSTSRGESSSRGTIADSGPLPLPEILDHEDENYTDRLPPKRRRIEEKKLDMKLDRSCFVTKPPPSFTIPSKKRPEKHPASFPGLNITNGGHVKGLVILGSRQRMGKGG